MKKRDVSKILFLALSATLTFASFRADAGSCMNGSFACGALTAGEVYTFDSSVYSPRGSAFTNSWSFSLANPTPLLLGVVRNAGFRIGGNNFGGVGDLDVKLYQGSTVMPVDEGGSGRNRTFESYFSLAPGSYSLVVSGIVRSDSGPGTYNGSFVAMVPEAETVAVMALGLGMVGWMVKRRKKQGQTDSDLVPA